MAKKAPAKKSAAKSGSETKAGSQEKGLKKPLKPSKELAAVVGSDDLPRTEAISKVWAYIKEKDLQNPQNRREILADDNLKKVFGKDKVTMFEMNKHLAQHLS